ncbi:MAG: hypothetical protein PVF68_08185 [Acidobacteriota bacterium]|jgi:tetratricopeptide (TPR) repeat protein
MSHGAAERSFRKGMKALGAGDTLAGLAHFEAAVRIALEEAGEPPTRYLSYYGLSLSQATDHVQEAEELCRKAVDREFYNPDLLLNLGKVYLVSGDRARAYQAFLSGLRLQGNHSGLLAEVRRMGIRRRPPLPFLSRTNPLNRMLGRMRRPPGTSLA